MTSILPRQREWTFRRVIAELPFIPAISNWLKLLLSLLAEPLMFLSSLCIIAETVLPGATTWPSLLINGPKAVMSLAPEIILPGCFQQAQAAQRDGNTIKGNLLLCLCAFFGLLTLITLASFIWHFSDAIANLILFIRCGAGISYTIILNISGHDGYAVDPSQIPSLSEHNDRIDHLTQTVNTLTAQLTTVLSITQNNHFLVTPLQEASQTEIASSETRPLPSSVQVSSPHLSAVIQPLRVNIRKGQTDLRLLALVDQHTTGDAEWISENDLLLLLRNPNPNVRQAVVRVLGSLGEQMPIERLLPLLEDPSASVRQAVVEVLDTQREQVSLVH